MEKKIELNHWVAREENVFFTRVHSTMDGEEWFCGEKRGSWKSSESVNSHIPPQINLKNMLPLFTSLVQIQWHSLTRINFNLLSDSGLSAGVSFWLLDRWLLCFLIGASSEIPQQRNPPRINLKTICDEPWSSNYIFIMRKVCSSVADGVLSWRWDVMCVWKYFCELLFILAKDFMLIR